MCDERDRLLGYLYDECDAAERRTVENHLRQCPGCREEIAGLRRVRTDLLAWDVPDHGSVWTPFVKSRIAPWWREVPVWAMAAAAGLVFVLGGAGAITAQALVGRAVAPAAEARPAGASAATQASAGPQATQRRTVTDAELVALEQRVAQEVRADIDARVQLLAAHQTTAPVSVSDGELLRHVSDIVNASERRQLDRIGDLHNMFMAKNVQTDARFTKIEDGITQIAAGQPGGKQ